MFADMSDQHGAPGATDQSDQSTSDHGPGATAPPRATHNGSPGVPTGSSPGEGAGGSANPGAKASASGDELADTPGDETGGGSARARNDRALIRRVAAKTEALRRAPKDHTKLLAAMLGVTATNLVELTVAVMTADRQALSVGRGLLDLADMDQMELAVAASGLERTELRKLWSFAAEAGAELGAVPAADAKAALAFARAVAALDKPVLDKVAAAIELGRKT